MVGHAVMRLLCAAPLLALSSPVVPSRASTLAQGARAAGRGAEDTRVPVHGPAGPNVPMWSAIYDFDIWTNGTGTTGFTNLLWDSNITLLGVAVAKVPHPPPPSPHPPTPDPGSGCPMHWLPRCPKPVASPSCVSSSLGAEPANCVRLVPEPTGDVVSCRVLRPKLDQSLRRALLRRPDWTVDGAGWQGVAGRGGQLGRDDQAVQVGRRDLARGARPIYSCAPPVFSAAPPPLPANLKPSTVAISWFV